MVTKGFNFSDWQNAAYIDRWTIPHTLTGFVLGMLLPMLGFSKRASLAITIVLVIAWEVFELSVGIYELVPNRITDILVALLGYWGARKVIKKYSDGVEKISLYVALLVLLITSSIGWLAFVADNASRL